MECEKCKYYHLEKGICCNKGSKHFATKPWEYGYNGCKEGIHKSEEIKTLEDMGFENEGAYYDDGKGTAIDISMTACRKYRYSGNRSISLDFTGEEIMAIAEILKRK